MTAPEEYGAFALAYHEAEQRAREEEEARERRNDALLSEGLHVYDPTPYPAAAPTPPAMYVDTGIGFLYDLPGCERFADELGDWTLGKEPKVITNRDPGDETDEVSHAD